MSSTRGGYDLLAPRFETTPFRTPDALLDCVVAHLRTGPPIERAVDVCCGTGAALGRLAPVCDRLVGIDFSPGMLTEARARLSHLGPRVQFVRGDTREMPLKDRQFDLATCFGAFGHIVRAEQPAFLRRIFDTLRPGGRFVFVTGPPPPIRSRTFWLCHGFNATMRVRNRLFRPPFVMVYLNFTLPEAMGRLVEAGFQPEIRPLGWSVRPDLKLVIGHRPLEAAPP